MRSLLITTCLAGFLGAQVIMAADAVDKSPAASADSKSKTAETAKAPAKAPAKADTKPVEKTPVGVTPTNTGANTLIQIKTSEGDLKVELADKEAPITVKNFVSYVNDKFYDGTVFHRVIDGFMVQGGGFTMEGDKLIEKPTRPPIANESKNGLKNARGTIAMARTSDPNSATAQFYINQVNNGSLDYPSFDGYGYAVFGKVIEGVEVVDKIAKVKTGVKSGAPNVPLTDVKIISIQVVH